MATEFCIDTAIRLHLSAQYDVVAVADAHTTGDRNHLRATQIIEHHNWTWQHIACPNGSRLFLRTTEQICEL